MTKDIKQKILNCNICLKYLKSQQAVPLVSHIIMSKLSWNKVSCDLFHLKGKQYLLTIDYYSKYIEVKDLGKDTTSLHVIEKLKGIFARHGIPLAGISDERPQFTSKHLHISENLNT